MNPITELNITSTYLFGDAEIDYMLRDTFIFLDDTVWW